MGAITEAANAKPKGPESGFDTETGELRIGEKVYRPRRYTRSLRKANTDLDNPELGARLLNKRAKITESPAKVTAADLRAFTNDNNEAADTTFTRVVLLFADAEGHPPVLSDAMDELLDQDAQRAVEFVVENPTGRKTETNSD